MKRNLSNIILVVVLLAGFGLILYPSLSDYWNSFHQSRAIAHYADAMTEIDSDAYDEIWNNAADYNDRLARTGIQWEPSEEFTEDYKGQLDVTGTGIMGYIEIRKIGCMLPVYHGTDDDILQIAIGHITGSSLPVGGSTSHCVLSGHRGLPSARLFTDLDQLEEGDTFVLRTLNEALTYKVDRIRIVLPYELDELKMIQGEDLCTLVTCTPYGVNTHRLLVRGTRIENAGETASILVTGDAFQIDSLVVTPLIAAPMLLILLLILFIDSGRKSRRNRVLRKLENEANDSVRE